MTIFLAPFVFPLPACCHDGAFEFILQVQSSVLKADFAKLLIVIIVEEVRLSYSSRCLSFMLKFSRAVLESPTTLAALTRHFHQIPFNNLPESSVLLAFIDVGIMKDCCSCWGILGFCVHLFVKTREHFKCFSFIIGSFTVYVYNYFWQLCNSKGKFSGCLTEWLRWYTRNVLANCRAGSNPAAVADSFCSGTVDVRKTCARNMSAVFHTYTR